MKRAKRVVGAALVALSLLLLVTFRAELRSDNRQYAEALTRDIATYGVRG